MIETRISLVLLCVLVGIAVNLVALSPSAVAPIDEANRAELVRLEDQLAAEPASARVAAEISLRYIELGRPGLAVAAVQGVPAEDRDAPVVLHRLAQAYEASGRLWDALATANLALDLCARAVGSSEASSREVRELVCTESQYAAFDMHQSALARMVAWGVVDPTTDRRTQMAYNLAVRSARVAAWK